MRLLLFLIFIIISNITAAQLPAVTSGSLVRWEQFPSRYVDARHIDIWLPENYQSSVKHRVIYMHDGQMLFDAGTTWNRQEWGVDETMGRLVHEGKTGPLIIVAIWNNGSKRHSEYFPQRPYEQLPAAIKQKLQPLMPASIADDYLKFIVQELKPAIDSAFATSPLREDNFIAGSSMGGLISLYAVCEYPEIFGGAACLSTHWPGLREANDEVPTAFMQYLQKHLPKAGMVKIWFDHGTETLDSLYAPYQQQADRIMKNRGYSSRNWITRIYPGAAHEEEAWKQRLEEPILFLLKR